MTDVHILFDTENKNYYPDPATNLVFLRAVSNHLNQLLMVRGHLFLNEVYDALDLPRTRQGAEQGWWWEEGSKQVNFFVGTQGLHTIDIRLDLDGVIYDRLP